MEQFEREAAWLLKEKYQGIVCDSYHYDLKRLKNVEPLAYLIGSVPFLNVTIGLASQPLIPRPETEYWVAEVIRTYQTQDKVPNRILDLCAGSGCIGVALGKAFSKARVDFVEIDTKHHPTIKDNCAKNEVENLGRIMGGHLFEHIPAGRRYDLIVSNPPYIDQNLGRVEDSVTEYEPALALYGGAEGLELIREIIITSPSYLTKEGSLWLEHEPEQVETITKIGMEHNFLVNTHKDQYQVQRFSELLLQ